MIIITFSGMQKFNTCRRLWYFSEYLKLKPKKEANYGPLAFGGRIHVPLEMWLKGEIDQPVDAWNALMAAEYAHADNLGWDHTTLDKEAKMGHAMLANLPAYLDESGFWQKFEPVHVEHQMKSEVEIAVEHHDGIEDIIAIRLQGKADVILRRLDDGTYVAFDWKTSAALAESILTVMAKSPQPYIYEQLASESLPDYQFSGSAYGILRKVGHTKTSNPPYYQVLEIPMTDVSRKAYRDRLAGVAEQVVIATERLDAGGDPDRIAYMDPNRVACMSCPFRAPCDMAVSFPKGVPDLLEGEYVEHDPLARYGTDTEDDLLS